MTHVSVTKQLARRASLRSLFWFAGLSFLLLLMLAFASVVQAQKPQVSPATAKACRVWALPGPMQQ